MRSEDFNAIVDQRCEKIKAILKSKAKEYAAGGDRLHNFRQAAHSQGVSLTQAVSGMAHKHIVSSVDLMMGRTKADANLVDEKLGDAINYFILAEAAFNDGWLHAPEEEPPIVLENTWKDNDQ